MADDVWMVSMDTFVSVSQDGLVLPVTQVRWSTLIILETESLIDFSLFTAKVAVPAEYPPIELIIGDPLFHETFSYNITDKDYGNFRGFPFNYFCTCPPNNVKHCSKKTFCLVIKHISYTMVLLIGSCYMMVSVDTFL